MTAIWRNDGTGWSLLAPAGFPNEAALHVLVEQAPHVLPLAGNPRLAILWKEVLLGNGYADLIATEASGRLVVIEVKLARNSEARRAVVAQVLTYAAFLRGIDVATLTHEVLGDHLTKRGHATPIDAVKTEDEEWSLDPATFNEGLLRSLSEGRFRLVLVLDQAPEELVQLVGYLGAVAEKVLIDVVTVSSYDIEGVTGSRPAAGGPRVPGCDGNTVHAGDAETWLSGRGVGRLCERDLLGEGGTPADPSSPLLVGGGSRVGGTRPPLDVSHEEWRPDAASVSAVR
jgi:hypothetical protein